MKAVVKQEDVVKHWGVYISDPTGEEGGWLMDDHAFIFSTTCPRVANVQHDMVLRFSDLEDKNLEVKEIA